MNEESLWAARRVWKALKRLENKHGNDRKRNEKVDPVDVRRDRDERVDTRKS